MLVLKELLASREQCFISGLRFPWDIIYMVYLGTTFPCIELCNAVSNDRCRLLRGSPPIASQGGNNGVHDSRGFTTAIPCTRKRGYNPVVLKYIRQIEGHNVFPPVLAAVTYGNIPLAKFRCYTCIYMYIAAIEMIQSTYNRQQYQIVPTVPYSTSIIVPYIAYIK